jgi:tetratricopeptide (TPR) repeat protein
MLATPWAAMRGAGSPEDLLREVKALLEAGQISAAQQKLQAGLPAYPDDPRLHNALGIVSAQQGDFSPAERHFRKAVELAPRFVDALLNLGRLYQQALSEPGMAGKAVAAYEAIVGFDPGHVEANYQLAVLLQHRGSYEQSQAHLGRLPSAAQQRSQALSVRCANLAALGKAIESEQAAQDLLRAADLSELDVTSILPVIENAAQTSISVVLLEGLAARQMASSESIRQLGLAYEREGRLEQARESLEKAAPGFKDNLTPLLRELARVAYKQQDYKGTLGYLAHARDLDPKDASIHFFFGMTCLAAELVIEARNSLQKAVDLSPDQPYYNYALGAVLSTQRNAGNAVPYLEKFLSMKPGDARGTLSLGVALYRSGDYGRAQHEFETVAQHKETAPVANYYLGRIALRSNELEQAEQYLQRAIDQEPKYPDAHADLGLAYIRQGRHEDAAKALGQAMEIDPESYRTNLNLLLLYQRTKDPRQDAQKEKFERLQKEQEEKLELVMRSIEVRPY